MQSAKSNTATPFCKVCFKPLKGYDTNDLFEDFPICSKCFQAMEPKTVTTKIDGIKATSFFVYNGKVRDMLYQCKGCADYEMAEVFLSRYKSWLRFKYRDWFLVPAPSFAEKNEKRGFNQVEEIFRAIDRPYLFAIKKTDNVKQADLNYVQRQKIGEHLAWVDGISVHGKKILFVDDLMTTGATAKACVKLLLEHGASKVEILTMARTTNPKERKENKISFTQKLLQIVDKLKKRKENS